MKRYFPGYRTISQLLSYVPSTVGMKMRRFWYKHTLESCGENLFVDWMAVLRNPRARIGNNVYVGVFCWLSWVDIGNDVLISGHSTIPSGGQTHGIAPDKLIRQQEVTLKVVRVGNDVWIANGCTILADVADGSVVGAMSVLTRPTEPYAIVVGNPAKKIGDRRNHVPKTGE